VVHTVSRTLSEAGDKLTEQDKKPVNDALEALREALKGEDKTLIEEKLKVVTDLSGGLTEKLHAAGGHAPGAAAGEAPQDHAAGKGDGVVDAEFEEVKGDGEDRK